MELNETMKDEELAAGMDINLYKFNELKKKYVRELAEISQAIARRNTINATKTTVQNANDGNAAAANTILQMTGAYTPKQELMGNVTHQFGLYMLPQKKAIGAPVDEVGKTKQVEAMIIDESDIAIPESNQG